MLDWIQTADPTGWWTVFGAAAVGAFLSSAWAMTSKGER